MTPDHALSPAQLAVQAERTDARQWFDCFAAAPPAVAAALGLAARHLGPRADLASVRSQVPFSHFNMVLNLGCDAVVDDAAFAAIEAFFAEGGCGQHWVLVNEHSQPSDLGARLLARGYREAGAWDRIVLRGGHPQRWQAMAEGCELVTPDTMSDWSAFLLRCYDMPTPIAHWLHALVGRPGWFHALLREGGQVVMARSLYVADDGWAWLGIDAPVPGVMAPCFAADQRVSAALLLAATSAGAHSFVSDIEAPSAERRGPAYQAWAKLGFEAEYLRRLFCKG